jgi:hypothetical protein
MDAKELNKFSWLLFGLLILGYIIKCQIYTSTSKYELALFDKIIWFVQKNITFAPNLINPLKNQKTSL